MTRSQLTSTVEQNTGGAVPPSVAGKNAVINGGFDIWQRGTSFTGGSAYTADRWQRDGNSNHTFSQQSAGSTLPQFRYCIRLQRDSGSTATGWIQLYNTFETVNSLPLAGQTVIVSFYARKGATFGSTNSRLTCETLYGTGTDQNWASFTGLTAAGYVDATITTSWQRYTYIANIPTTATEIAVGFKITDLVGTAGASDYAEVTGVQLELGSVATPFSRNGSTIQGELAACQRYYWRSTGGAYTQWAMGYCTSTTNFRFFVPNPVSFRVAPTGIDYSLPLVQLAAGNLTPSALTIAAGNSTNGTTIDATISGGTTDKTGFIFANGTSGYLALSAEL